jgi:predicted nucleotidyltransferase
VAIPLGTERVKMKAATPLSRATILRELRKHGDVLKKYSVKRIGLFSSYIFGKPHKLSDIDFLVEFEEPTFDNYMSLIDYLEESFRRKVEILTPQGVDSIRVRRVADDILKSVSMSRHSAAPWLRRSN